MRIAWKLGIALAVAAVLPILAAGILAMRIGEQILLEEAMASEQRAARSGAELVSQQLESLRHRFAAAVSSFELDVGFTEKEFLGYAQLAAGASPEVRAVALVNLERQLMLPEPVYGTSPGFEPLEAEDIRSFYQYIRIVPNSPRAVLGGIFPSARSGSPLAVFTQFRYLKGEGGAEDRAWALAWLVDLTGIRAKLESAALGPGESLTLLDERQGSVFAPVSAAKRSSAKLPALLAAAIPEGRGARLWPGPKGELIVAAEPVPQTGWRLFVHRPSELALAPARALRDRVAGVWAALALSCVLATAAFLARGIARPIRSLSQAALAVAAGERRGQLPEKGGGELAELARSFNRMSTEVAKAADELQARIDERTADLSLAKESLQISNTKLQVLADNLARFLPAQFVERLFKAANEPMLLAHRRVKLTMAFADLVGFTDASDQLEPEQLTRVVNTFFEEMTAVAEMHGGTVAKFMGDGVMVFFGDPEFVSDEHHAASCVKMALMMQERITTLGEGWARDGIEHPPLLRVGINTGYAAVGLFGSGNRTEYTAIGRQVNLTSRLQSAAEPGAVVLSHPTYALVKDLVEVESRGEVMVKGISRPISVFKLLRLIPPQSPAASA